MIIDLFSRRVIAHKISCKIDTRLVLDTFESALKNRIYPQNVIFHSDRGSQYTSDEFRKRLDKATFIPSFSKKGHPYDNAVAEAFFKFLKLEEINRNSYHSIEEVELSVFEYIHFYNFNRFFNFSVYFIDYGSNRIPCKVPGFVQFPYLRTAPELTVTVQNPPPF